MRRALALLLPLTLTLSTSLYAQEVIMATSRDLKEFDQLLEKSKDIKDKNPPSPLKVSPRVKFNAPTAGTPVPPPANGPSTGPDGHGAGTAIAPATRLNPGPSQPPDMSGHPPLAPQNGPGPGGGGPPPGH